MKILVAMSGGVDSSVAALRLRDEGHDVAGITMMLGYIHEGIVYHIGETAAVDAEKVCRHLGIPHYTEDCIQIFNRDIIGNFTAEYAQGRTPNPCVRCNRILKFGALFDRMNSLGFDRLATGHYADKGRIGPSECIKKNGDVRKDQSYFLYAIERNVLPHLLFPIHDLTKPDVRTLASKNSIPVAHKKESQDICFIADDYRDFKPMQNAKPINGYFVNSAGKRLGTHNGIPFYTIGQRRGLGVSAPAPLYVTAFDCEKNEIVLGYRDELLSQGLIAHSLNLFTDILPGSLKARIRYAHKEQPCTVTLSGDEMKVVFDSPQDAITPGQSVVLYHDDCVVGGGIIERALPVEG
jgi:tRNA-uridine 2-sulfurtransferase